MPTTLDIAGTSTTTGALRPVALDPLRAVIKRGDNRLIPGRKGRRPKALVIDEVEVAIEWRLNGWRDPAGVVYPDYEEGLETNHRLYEALFTQGADANGEKAATLHTAVDDLTGRIQVLTFDPYPTGPATKTILTLIRVPAGEWT